METVYDCSLVSKDRDVQLQAVKCILTALTSTTCSVHGQTLVSASYACWNIYLLASDDTIRNTARAALTQTFSLVFQRMETHGSQLKQMQQSAAMQTNTALAADSSAAAGKAADKTADNSDQKIAPEERKAELRGSTGEEEKEVTIEVTAQRTVEEEKTSEENGTSAQPTQPSIPPTAIMTSSTTATPASLTSSLPDTVAGPAQASTGTETVPSASSAPSPTPASSSDVSMSARPPPGKRGYCVVCWQARQSTSVCRRRTPCAARRVQAGEPAATRQEVHHRHRRARRRSRSQVPHPPDRRLTSSSRALIRISKKPLPSPAEPSRPWTRKLLSLDLLLSITEGSRARHSSTSPNSSSAVRQGGGGGLSF